MSENIRYYTDGEQATADTLNRPLEDLSKNLHYMTKVQFDALAAERREKYAGSGIVDEGIWSPDGDGFNLGMNMYTRKRNFGTSWKNTLMMHNSKLTGQRFNINGVSILGAGTRDYDSNKRMILKFPEASQTNTVPVITDSTNMPEMKQGDMAILKGPNFKGNIAKPLSEYPEQGGWEHDGDKITRTSGDTNSSTSHRYFFVQGKTYTCTYTVEHTGGDGHITSYTDSTDDGVSNPTYIFGSSNGSGTFTVKYVAKDTGYFNVAIYGINDFRGSISNYSIVQEENVIICATSSIPEGSNLTTYSKKFEGRDSVSRQDLVFLETWHEDVSEKGLVYPYGNIQYRGTNTDDLSNIQDGTFTGADTYSLFGNWQTAGDLVGKGYIWGDLDNDQRELFARNPDNNIYTDKGKTIQVRYRVRVVKGLGNDWQNVGTNNSRVGYNTNDSCLNIKGNKDNRLNEFVKGAGGAGDQIIYFANKSYGHNENGIWHGFHGNNFNVFALPIALVQRRNAGAFHKVFNPEGTAMFFESSTGKNWYEISDTFVTSMADCFNTGKIAVYNAGNNSWDSLSNISDNFEQTGLIASGKSGREDGLYADEINERDVEDLRMSAHKRDYKELMDEYNNKAIAGEIRGKENEIFLKPVIGLYTVSGGIYLSLSKYGYNWKNTRDGYVNKTIKAFNKTKGKIITLKMYSTTYPHVLRVQGGTNDIISYDDVILIPWEFNNLIQNNTMTHTDIIGDPRKLQDRIKYTTTGSAQSVSLGKNDYILNAVAGSGDDYDGTVGNYYRFVGIPGSIDLDNVDYTTTDFIDLDSDGAIGGYKQEWLENGIEGSPLLVGENGESLLPVSDFVDVGQDNRVFKISKKCKTLKKVLVLKKDNTFQEFTVQGGGGDHLKFGLNTSSTGANNSLVMNIDNSYEDLGYASEQEMLDLMIVLVTYETKANFLELSNNTTLLDNGKVNALSEFEIKYGSTMGSLINKVFTGGHLDNKELYAEITKNGDKLHTSYPTSHKGISKLDSTSAAVKFMPYLAETNSVAKLQYVFKEMKWDNDLDSITEFATIDNNNKDINGVAKTYYNISNEVAGPLSGLVVYCIAPFNESFDSEYWTIDSQGNIRSDNNSIYMKLWDGNGWGDNNKFEIADKISTLTDDNGNTVLYGQKSFNLPYFIK